MSGAVLQQNTVPWAKMARTLASEAGLTVEFDKESENPQPRVDMEKKVIYVPPPDPRAAKESLWVWFGMLCHEIGHLRPRARDILPAIQKHDISMASGLGRCVNLVDDFFQERLDMGMYKGRDRALSKVQAWACSRGAALVQERPGTASGTLFAWYYTLRSEFQPDISISDLQSYLENADLALFEELDSKFSERMFNVETAEDEIALAKDIFDVLKESEAYKKESDPDESGGGPGGSAGEAVFAKGASEQMAHTHSDGEQGEFKTFESEPPYDVYRYKYTCDYRVIREFKKTPFECTEVGNPLVTAEAAHGLSQAVLRLLQARSQARYQGGFKRGRIQAKALHRVPLGSDTVFKRRVQSLKLDTAVLVLMDCSGSMEGFRDRIAAGALVALSDAIAPLGVPLALYGFSSVWRQVGCDMYEFKSFSTPYKRERLAERLASSTVQWQENPDGDALLFAHHVLSRTDAAKKALIVLSDGIPSSSNRGDEHTFLAETCKFIERSGTRLYGIGIESKSVKNYYSKHSVINDVSELPSALLSVVQSEILG